MGHKMTNLTNTMRGLGEVKLYYWRGPGFIGSLVRHASSSQWGHVAVGFTHDGKDCFIDSYPGVGARVARVSPHNPPEGVQRTGIVWKKDALCDVCRELWLDGNYGSGIPDDLRFRGVRPYSYLNGVLAAFGFRRDPDTGEVRDKRGKPRPFLGLMTIWGRDGAVQCAQAAEMALRVVGLDIGPNTIPEPQGIATQVELLTGHPVRLAGAPQPVEAPKPVSYPNSACMFH